MPVLVLTNEEIKTLVPISAYVDAIEAAYREFGLGRAVIQPRTDLYGESPAENRYCVFKSMAGLLVKDHVVALRHQLGCHLMDPEGRKTAKRKDCRGRGRTMGGTGFYFRYT
jgi:hypothetical protein